MKKKILLVISILFIGITNVFADEWQGDEKWAELPNNSYLIGEYLFTREENEAYEGKLTTSLIMEAAKSIQDGDPVRIYYKDSSGKIRDGLSGEIIDIKNIDEITITYYNMLKLPKMSIDLWTTEKENGVEYQVSIDSNGDWDSISNLKWEFYGAEKWDGYWLSSSGPEAFESTSPKIEPLKTNMSVEKVYMSDVNDSSYTFTLQNGKSYGIDLVPYILENDNKYYIFGSNLPLSTQLNNKLKVSWSIPNNKIVAKLTDNTGREYGISSAELFAMDGSYSVNIELHDILKLVSQNETLMNKFKGDTEKKLKSYTDKYQSSTTWRLANLYQSGGLDGDPTQVSLYDIGNSENEQQYYKIVLHYIGEIDGVFGYYTASAIIQQKVLIKQPTIDNDYMNSHDYDLLSLILN